MVTNNEAVDNFLNGKRNLAAYQFSQLMKETITTTSSNSNTTTTTTTTTNHPNHDSATSAITGAPAHVATDEIAFNYAMVNLFTGCPKRASIIFSDLVRRYPRNPRLWLRLAESMLAAEQSKMSEFEHIQQLARPNSRDHLIKTKNRPILIKINPKYCQQQKLQHAANKAPPETPPNFLANVKGFLQKSLDLINEYNDISLLTDTSQLQQSGASSSSVAALTNLSASSSSMQPSDSSRLSHQLSYAEPYKSISRSALYHLRIKVQLNLAYICLCMGEPIKALAHTTQCLKSSPQGYEKVLASLYHAEACILANRIDEATQFLNLEVFNMAKNLSQQDHHQSIDKDALATVVTYNLSVACAAKGEFINAQKILMRCIAPTEHIPMQLIICLLYIQLQQGQVDAAKKTILSNLPQFN